MAGLGSGAAGLGGVDDLRNSLAEDLGLDDEAANGDVGDKDGTGKDEPKPDDKPDYTANNAADEPTSDDGGEQPAGEPDPPVVTAAPSPISDPAPVMPPVEPVAEQANPTTRTPCEIAADELPNVGE